MKKKKEAKTTTKRKIYRDFTLAEFDLFTLDIECDGARHERNSILDELRKAQANLRKYSNGVGPESKRIIDGIASGVTLAVALIEKMPEYEDRCECSDCKVCDE
jgi:hypothetical protein